MKKTSLYIMMLLLCKLSFSELILNTSNLSPSKNEDFNIEVSFLNEDKSKYTIEGIENFDVLSRASSNSYNSINGKTTSAKSDVYRVRAKSEGEFTLTVKTEKGLEKSIVIKIQKSESINSNLSDKFVLKTVIPKREFYFGEKIPYEEYFISGVRVSSFNIAKSPDFKEFSVKDLTQYNNNSYIQNTVDFNGKPGVQLSLFKGILQANSSGNKKISSSSAKIGEPTRDFFYENTSYVGGEDIELEIKPLPGDAPKNFKDIVGTLSSLQSWKGQEVKVGEAVTLTLTLQGSGNLALLDSLPIEQNDDFNIFQNIKGYNEKIGEGKYFNEKIFEVAFIPKKNGIQKTPAINIPYFNTVNEKYEILTLEREEIKVSGNSVVASVDNSNIQSNSPIDKNTEIKTLTSDKKLSEDIKNIKEVNINLLEVEKQPVKNSYKLISMIIGFFALLQTGFILYLLRTRKKVLKTKKR
ncbi:BatD family protein [Cetobacterium sp.]|uniref:BatD family protein n=1 Tax=Cetobacterium sp. TaxID=2071632 RepID=UPI003F41200C